MKKIHMLCSLFAALCLTAFTGCNDNDGDYPNVYGLITTIHAIGEGDETTDFYFERDNGETLYPSERPSGFEAEDNRRAVIYFDLLAGAVEGYDYNIRLYRAEKIFTGTSQVVTTREELEALGGDSTGFNLQTFNLTRKWLTFYALYPVTDNSKHTFALAVDRTPDAPEGRDIEVGSDGASEEGYLDVVLCHSAGGDAAGYTQGYYISFDLEPIAGELEGMKGIKLRIDTFENGTKYIKLDLPQEK